MFVRLCFCVCVCVGGIFGQRDNGGGLDASNLLSTKRAASNNTFSSQSEKERKRLGQERGMRVKVKVNFQPYYKL